MKFSQNFSSLALKAWDLRCLEDLQEKDQLPTQLMRDEAVCRAAPATPGLVIIFPQIMMILLAFK